METKAQKRSRTREEWRQVLYRLPWLLLLPLGYGLTKLAAAHPDDTEVLFSTGIYPYISVFVGKLSSLARWVSLAEVLIIITLLTIILIVVVKLVRLIMGKLSFARFVGFLVSLFIAFGVLFNLFYFEWGFNYFRPSLYERMDLDVEARPVEELESLCYELATRAAALRTEVEEDETGVFTLPEGYAAYFNQIPNAYVNLGMREAVFSGTTYPAKGVLASLGMSYAGISGIYIPFTNEANVNIDQPALYLLSTAAHETAHFLGVAREDEANFVAYLACTSSEIPAIQYSGAMHALTNCANQLYAADPDKYNGVRATYTEGMLRDLVDYNKYWASFEGPVEETVTRVNDNYLKFNAQEEGVKSYGMMVDLLLAYAAKSPAD